MEVIEELVNQLCPKDCIYRVPLTPTTDFCAYCLAKYESRGCKVSECDKYATGTRIVTMGLGTLNYEWIEDDDGEY